MEKPIENLENQLSDMMLEEPLEEDTSKDTTFGITIAESNDVSYDKKMKNYHTYKEKLFLQELEKWKDTKEIQDKNKAAVGIILSNLTDTKKMSLEEDLTAPQIWDALYKQYYSNGHDKVDNIYNKMRKIMYKFGTPIDAHFDSIEYHATRIKSLQPGFLSDVWWIDVFRNLLPQKNNTQQEQLVAVHATSILGRQDITRPI